MTNEVNEALDSINNFEEKAIEVGHRLGETVSLNNYTPSAKSLGEEYGRKIGNELGSYSGWLDLLLQNKNQKDEITRSSYNKEITVLMDLTSQLKDCNEFNERFRRSLVKIRKAITKLFLKLEISVDVLRNVQTVELAATSSTQDESLF